MGIKKRGKGKMGSGGYKVKVNADAGRKGKTKRKGSRKKIA